MRAIPERKKTCGRGENMKEGGGGLGHGTFFFYPITHGI